MAMSISYRDIDIASLLSESSKKRHDKWRFVQILAVLNQDDIDVLYTFDKNGQFETLKLCGVTKADEIPSITGDFFEAFVFENEIHDLFGLNITNIALDFKGNFYAVSASEPMTILTPEQKEARDKAYAAAQAKLEAAKAEASVKEEA